MNANSTQAASPRPRLRWHQYTVRTLLLLTAIVAAGLSWLATRAARQRSEVDALLKIEGCDVAYDWDSDSLSYISRVCGIQREADADAKGLSSPTTLTEKTLGNLCVRRNVAVAVPLQHVDEALPHLKRLPGLRNVHVVTRMCDVRGKAMSAAIKRIERELPDVEVRDVGFEVRLQNHTDWIDSDSPVINALADCAASAFDEVDRQVTGIVDSTCALVTAWPHVASIEQSKTR